MLQRKNAAEQKEAAQLRCEMGSWLKQLREKKGMSQRDLANALGLDYYTFISQLENGRGKIPKDRYRDWANALDQDVCEFVKTLLSYYDPISYAILFEERR